MYPSTLRRCLTVGVLSAIFTAAGTAPANARDLGSWLQDVWKQGVSVLWAWQGTGEPGAREVPYRAKQGPGVDPDGTPRPSSAQPPCGTCTDQGYGVDPDG